MRALVTGATGFIGTSLAQRLTAASIGVRALVRAGSDVAGLESRGIEIVRGDVQSPTDVERAMDGCELAFHLAVDRRSRASILAGAENVGRAAAKAGARRIVFTSSAGVYRKVRHGLVDEDTPIDPDPGYHSYQAEAERILLDRWSRGGSPVVIARVTSLGPGSPAWRGVFESIATGTFRMIGTGENHYQPIDVSDIVEWLVRCGTVPDIEGRVYILAGDRPHRLKDIVRAIEDELGVTTSKSSIPIVALSAYRALNNRVVAASGRNLPRHDRASFFLYDRSFDVSRAREELGYSPQVPLREMIRRAVIRYRDQGYLPDFATAGAKRS
jgi:nucleoside-diphosphate-sugar epimerase